MSELVTIVAKISCDSAHDNGTRTATAPNRTQALEQIIFGQLFFEQCNVPQCRSKILSVKKIISETSSSS